MSLSRPAHSAPAAVAVRQAVRRRGLLPMAVAPSTVAQWELQA